MSTEYIYSQFNDKYNNTKFCQPKGKGLVKRQDRPPKFVSCKLDTQEVGSQKKVTHPQLIINAAFFINKNPYVNTRLDMNVTILLNEMQGTGTSPTFRKIQTSMTFYSAPPVLQPEY